MLIEPIELHWFTPDHEESDLCVHGGIRISVGSIDFLDTGFSDNAVSTAALNLLRSLERDHTPADPITDHLFPCCGHFMVVDKESGEVINVNCGHGFDWTIRHLSGGRVQLVSDGTEVIVTEKEYLRAVVDFAKRIRDFYAGSRSKTPSNSQDAEWFDPFIAEFDRRLLAAASAA